MMLFRKKKQQAPEPVEFLFYRGFSDTYVSVHANGMAEANAYMQETYGTRWRERWTFIPSR